MFKKYINDFTVKDNIRLNSDTFLLVLQHPAILPQIIPGQFVEALVEDAPFTFLRRPFSVHDVDLEQNTITLFIKIVGKGTEKLSYLLNGNTLNLVYPLGNSFTIVKRQKVLLVGGGFGIAPLMNLAKVLFHSQCDVHILLGARSSCDILLLDTFKKYGKVYITTDDGSLGIKGFLTQHPAIKDEIKSFERLYVCGPEVMMQSVARLAKKNNVTCEVSLENTMACGIGACLCCVVDTESGHRCVCTDGPVFNINDLKWQI